MSGRKPASSPAGLQPGDRAPDFVLPSREGGITTFYEDYCGRPALVLLSDRTDNLPTAAVPSDASLAVVPGPPGQALADAPLRAIGDDGRLRRALIGADGPTGGRRCIALAFDAQLRLRERFDDAPAAATWLQQQPTTDTATSADRIDATAPVLIVPELLPDDLCRRLIAAHEADNAESGMVRMVDGKPSLVPDPKAKRRRDHSLTDDSLVRAVSEAVQRRLLPEIHRAFNYPVTRFERFKIASYDGADRGHFALHRDNATPDATHRRFALTVNLNQGGPTGAYQGGDLVFPEFGQTRYGPPAGGAIVFSGGLLHGVDPVTSGRRYALITFLWGEEAQRGR